MTEIFMLAGVFFKYSYFSSLSSLLRIAPFTENREVIKPDSDRFPSYLQLIPPVFCRQQSPL